MKIMKYYNSGICEIVLSGIWQVNKSDTVTPEMDACTNIMRTFTKGTIYCFEFFRESGFNIYNQAILLNYRKSIPEYFEENGNFYIQYYKKLPPKRFDSRFRAAGQLVINDETYEMISKFFNYYMDAVVFVPHKNLSWEMFVEDFKKHPMERAERYIRNGFTDLVFVHTDDSDFIVCFDMKKYDEKTVLRKIGRYISPFIGV